MEKAPGLPTSVTDLIKDKYFKTAWRDTFPETRSYLKAQNRLLSKDMAIPPSHWTSQRRWAVIGTAFDLAMGAIVAKSSLRKVLSKVHIVLAQHGVLGFHSVLEETIQAKLPEARTGELKANDHWFSAIVLLAQLEATTRNSNIPLPQWLLRKPKFTARLLKDHLLHQYTDEVSEEMQALISAGMCDLPSEGPFCYNPVFGGDFGPTFISADGDIIIGTTLLDFKVSACDYNLKQTTLMQLLCYAALSAYHGKYKVREVGFYNPRYRNKWEQPLEKITQGIGGATFRQFSAWLEETVS